MKRIYWLGAAGILQVSTAAAATAPMTPEQTRTVMEWALGKSRRDPPRGSAPTIQVINGKPQPSPPPAEPPPKEPSPPPAKPKAAETKLDATSLLRSRPGDRRIFLVSHGQLQATASPQEAPYALPLPANQASGMRLSRLIATSKAGPLVLYATMQPQQPDGALGTEQLWQLTIEQNKVVRAEPAGMRREFETAAAFFNAFNVPRCLPGGADCLLPNRVDGITYLYLEPRRGQPTARLRQIGADHVLDAVWADDQAKQIYLLVAPGAG